MRKRISTIIFVIIFLIGLSILLYPAVSEYVNERHSSRAIASYDKLVEELPEADYSKELQDAQAYNEYLAQFGNLSEAASTEKDRETVRKENRKGAHQCNAEKRLFQKLCGAGAEKAGKDEEAGGFREKADLKGRKQNKAFCICPAIYQSGKTKVSLL